MDGPNVNFKLMDLLQKEHAELHGGAQVIDVGSCGLHTLHNAMKAGFTACHRWIENVPVAERAIAVWPMLQMYVDAAEKKKVQKPSTASYNTILAAQGDPFIIPKLQFFLAISRSFNPFLTRYQTDEPVLPFLAKDLTELLMSLLRRFVKREILKDRTPRQLTQIEVSEEKNWVSLRNLDIGLGAECAIKQFTSLLSVEGRDEEFVSFQPLKQRLDVFLHSKLSMSHPELLRFCQSVLLLSHGQATVERGFSVHKEVETCNLLDESLEALRLI
ncbi:hypothetical protein ABVT39_006167 [Epinephelus coioides]